MTQSIAAEQRTPKTSTLTETPPTQTTPQPPFTTAEQLIELEKQAIDAGVKTTELEKIRQLGGSPDQIRQRVARLETWLLYVPYCT